MFSARITISILICSITVASSQESLFPLMTMLEQHKLSTCDENHVNLVVRKFDKCFKSIVNNFQLDKFSPEIITNKVCKTNFIECFQALKDDLKNCFREEVFNKVFQMNINTIKGAQNYACSNDGKPLKDFLEHGVNCFENKQSSKKDQCVEEMQQIRQSWSNQRLEMDQVCRNLGKGNTCLVTVIEEICNDETTRNFFRDLIWSALKETECKQIIENEFQSLVSISISLVANFSLVIAAIISVLIYL